MALISENWKWNIFQIVAALAIAFYFLARRTYSYWERMNFKTLPNVNYLSGHFKTIFTRKQSFSNLIIDLYNQTTEPFIGMYGTYRPILFVRDPELMRSILVKDFNNFINRGFYCNEKRDPLSGHLFSLSGHKWKNLRTKLSPAFSSSKLKAMFSTFVASGVSLQKYLDQKAENGESIKMRDLTARYTTNNIASVAFGIEIDTIANPHDDFRKCGQRIVQITFLNNLRALLSFIAPKIMNLFHIHATDRDAENFIFSIVKQNLEHREKNNITRKDLFQLLIQLRSSGTVHLDGQWESVIKNDENQKKMTIAEMAAQVFGFFVAGYETSSSTLSYCILELAKQPELQIRVQNEIDCVLERHNGEITYESIAEMKLAENCIDETLRMFPILPVLNRVAMNDYRIPGTKNIIEKGVGLLIPVIALHHDEKYYPEPSKFKPERFSDEESVDKNQINRPYLPFGDGPRYCVGMRMGKLQAKIGLVLMLQKFSFTLVSKEDHKNPLDFHPKAFMPYPRNGINLNVVKRSDIT